MATYVCVVEPFARVHVTVVDELKAYPEEMLKQRGAQWLTSAELASWESMQAKQTRRMEWLFGRIALKEAVCAWMLEMHQLKVDAKELIITRTDAGAPQATWAEDRALVLPVVSLAHAPGVMVAAVSGTESVGVDVERFDRPATTVARVLTETETALVAQEQMSLLSAVVAKEAASKAVGLGLGGDLRRWPIIAGSPKEHFVSCVDDPELLLKVDFLTVPGLVLGVCVVV
ncbi:MAG: 4'-phosphopantetheinyl transferase superfamily protein [Actinomycetota bacterium]|nr:4'-phosphopantetheinyl transferase superfamily protein [Actinomycetota bacterium]